MLVTKDQPTKPVFRLGSELFHVEQQNLSRVARERLRHQRLVKRSLILAECVAWSIYGALVIAIVWGVVRLMGATK